MRTLRLATFAIVFAALSPLAQAADPDPSGCDRFLNNSGAPKPFADGFTFTEGPAWSPKGYFIFSDVPKNTIFKIGRKGKISVLQSPSGYGNGNTFSPDGVRYTARHDRSVGVTPLNGVSTKIITEYGGKKLNSPNDIIRAKDGAIWFTDPDFGITGYGPEKATPEQPVQGVYRWKDGKLTLMISNLGKPNGLAFTPGEKALIVSDTATYKIYRYEVLADGSLDQGKPFGEIPAAPGANPIADGLKIDRQGNVWAAGSKSIGIFTPDGALACRLTIESAHVSNLAFGGKRGTDVLVTANDKIFMLKSRISGL